jgi:hypothetical protein
MGFNSYFWYRRIIHIKLYTFYCFDREELGAGGVYILYPDVKMLLLGDLLRYCGAPQTLHLAEIDFCSV